VATAPGPVPEASITGEIAKSGLLSVHVSYYAAPTIYEAQSVWESFVDIARLGVLCILTMRERAMRNATLTPNQAQCRLGFSSGQHYYLGPPTNHSATRSKLHLY
jgi:hypothetical protein